MHRLQSSSEYFARVDSINIHFVIRIYQFGKLERQSMACCKPRVIVLCLILLILTFVTYSMSVRLPLSDGHSDRDETGEIAANSAADARFHNIKQKVSRAKARPKQRLIPDGAAEEDSVAGQVREWPEVVGAY